MKNVTKINLPLNSIFTMFVSPLFLNSCQQLLLACRQCVRSFWNLPIPGFCSEPNRQEGLCHQVDSTDASNGAKVGSTSCDLSLRTTQSTFSCNLFLKHLDYITAVLVMGGSYSMSKQSLI